MSYTPTHQGSHSRSNSTSGQVISRSNSSLSLNSSSSEASSPSRHMSRSNSTLNVTLEIEPQQIVYPYTLSSVLNDPKARQAHFQPPVISPSPHLIDAPLASYKPYLQKTHEIYSILQNQRKHSRDLARAEDEAKKAAEGGSTASGDSDSNDQKNQEEEEVRFAERLSMAKRPVIIDSRKEVPLHFFDEGFSLAIAQTFYNTFYDGTPHNVLANKIDEYLELVERDLTDKLNKRSDAFFRALRDLQSLHLTVAEAFQTVENLRGRLKTADEELVVKALDIVGKKTKKQNSTKIQQKLKMIQAVHRSIPTIEEMIENERYFEAIETIRMAEMVIKAELQGANCIENFKTKLDKLSKIVKGHLSALFVEVACGRDVLLEEDVDKLRPLVVEMQHVGQLISTLETYSDIQRDNIKLTVADCFKNLELNLAESNGNDASSSDAIGARTSTPEPGALTLSSSTNNLGTLKKPPTKHATPHSSMFSESEEHDMGHYEGFVGKLEMETFKPVLDSLLQDLLSMIGRSKEIHNLIDQVFKDIDAKELKDIEYLKTEMQAQVEELNQNEEEDANRPLFSKSDSRPSTPEVQQSKQKNLAELEMEHNLQKRLRTQISIDSAGIVFTTAELANALIARLLRVREELHHRLPVQEFASLYNIVMAFIKSTDKQVGRPCPTLRATLNAQAKSMFEDWDRRMVKKLNHTLMAENWARAEIAGEFAAIINCLYTPKQLIHSLDLKQGTDTALKSLTLGAERFVFVNSELIFAKFLYDYMVFLDAIPSMYADIIAHVADMINLWSKLTYGLVLKQGAVENQVVTGSINVGHLSLAANCLGVQIALIPRIKERVLGYIQDPSEIAILSCLDKSIEECTNHQQEIYTKIITTMRNRVDACFKAYKVEENTDRIHSAIAKLTDATKKMHKILKTYLSPTPFKFIFKQIIIIYNSQIKSHLNTLVIRTPKEKSKLLLDVNHILTELRALENVEDPTDELSEFVHERFKQ